MRHTFETELEENEDVVQGKEWDTLTLLEGSPILGEDVEWDETWGDQLTIKICRVLFEGSTEQGESLGGAWFITEAFNAFEEEVELPLAISDIIEDYLEHKQD